jgi:predicted MPP superfamily phosphohydrolase
MIITNIPFSPTWLLIIFSAGITLWVWQPSKSSIKRDFSRRRNAGAAALAILSFGVIDWVLLTSLPHLDLSYGPLEPGFLGITVIRFFLLFILLLPGFWRNARISKPQKIETRNQSFNFGLAFLWGTNIALSACAFYGLYIEPFALSTSVVDIPGPTFESSQGLRVLHLSDLHIEYITKREQKLIDHVNKLQPDLILWTGDYLNVDYLDDPQTREDAIKILSQISAPMGVYAVIGTVDRQNIMHDLFRDLDAIILDDEIEKININGKELNLLGVSNFYLERDQQAFHNLMRYIPEDDYSILLYHTPDLAYDAAQEKVDLYLAGHTHGGQIRLPFYGAVVTFSIYGKQFESGLYTIDQTNLYVSRGIGMEGFNLPRVRFLCPPEIILFNIEL